MNWSALRQLLVDFISPRLRFSTDILNNNDSNNNGVISDLGPSLIDGKVILALLHHASPKECPYDPYPEEWANSPNSSKSKAGKEDKSKMDLSLTISSGGRGSKKSKKDLTCEEAEAIRRTAFTRANVLFGCPPILSDG